MHRDNFIFNLPFSIYLPCFFLYFIPVLHVTESLIDSDINAHK
jgi:hypothetical protein